MPPQWARTGQEKNRGRKEIRSLCAALINPEQACFPGAAQCAILLRQGLGDQPDAQYLLTSRTPEHLPARQWLDEQRNYWGIEAGLHQRLDVSADEDRSRVRHRNCLLNVGQPFVRTESRRSYPYHQARLCDGPG